MGGRAGLAGLHAHLHVPGASVVHRLPAAAKLLGTVGFALAVALTPRRAWPAFAIDAVVLGAVVVMARLPIRTVLARLVAVVPFVGVAALVPFVSDGPEVEVLGVVVSGDGLWAAFGIVAKALLGAGASIVLAATTPIPELIRGLGRLRVPVVLIGIVTFMFRDLDLIADQLRRMRTAMAARGHDARWLWQARPIAASAGALFVRSYERGERVHLAMVARGFTGVTPDVTPPPPDRPARVALAAMPTVLAAAAAIGWLLT
jgi:cobalt/nickel transport system permease protein